MNKCSYSCHGLYLEESWGNGYGHIPQRPKGPNTIIYDRNGLKVRQQWMNISGDLDRIDGPAVEYTEYFDEVEFWLNGRPYDFYKWFEKVKNLLPESKAGEIRTEYFYDGYTMTNYRVRRRLKDCHEKL